MASTRNAYQQLKAEEDREKRQWVARAHKSECAGSIEHLFKNSQPRDKISQLKQQMFDQIYTAMGDEVEPEDLLRAVVVHYQKFNDIFVYLLSILTLGLFLLFKPRDDDTVLVLTKRDRRVLTIRKERTNFCEGRNTGAVLMFARYITMLFIVLSLPGFLYIVVWDSTHPDETADESIYDRIVEHEDDVLHFYDLRRRKKRLKSWFVALVILVFTFWLYTNVPRGTHGTRTQMNYSANNLAAAQFTHTGGNFRRRGVLRLFFGKYPTQAVLDTAGTLALGHVAGPVPPSELSGKGWTTPALITGLTLLLSVITIMDSGFAWADRSATMGHLAYVMQFCVSSPRDAVGGPRYCTEQRCRAWAMRRDIGTGFCRHVKWLDHLQDGDDNLICLAAAGGKPPCCSGCETFFWVNAGWYSHFRSTISFIGDFGTLVFSYMAAKVALGYTNHTGEVQIMFERRHLLKKQTADVDLVRPLTLLFLDSIFNNAPPDDSTFTDSSSEEDPAHGVRNFRINNTIANWDDFIKQHTLVEVVQKFPGKLALKVHVPVLCLGLLSGEEVLAAWAELPDQIPGPLPYAFCVTGAIQHAVILTNRRLFYIRVMHRWALIEKLGKDVRVDIFRHDCDVFFGHLNNMARTVMFQLAGAQWRPGDVFMQDRFGVLSLSRAHGNALKVYNMVWQISKVGRLLQPEEIAAAGVDMKSCTAEVKSSLTCKHDKVWALARQPDDVAEVDPELHLTDVTEQPIFSWSFKERGAVMSPFSFNNTVVMTTGRVFVWKRAIYKPFDCRICCWWTCLWCGCLKELFSFSRSLAWAERLPSTMSFMTLASILSFSTERCVEPPLCCCCDPMHPSWQFPCWEEICTAFTNCLTRRTACLKPDRDKMRKLPGRAGPRTQLWFMWRLKQQAQEQDLEVACNLSPCAMPEDADSDGEDMAHLREMVERCPITYEEQTKKTRLLWKLLGLALRSFDKDRLPV